LPSELRIDVHAHLYPPGYLDTLRAGGPLTFGRDSGGREVLEMDGARVVTLTPEMQGLEQRLADMDDVGIGVQVLSLSAPNVYFPDAGQARELARVSNEHFAQVVAGGDGRFRAFASVPINHPDVALEELEYALDVLGLEGVILGTIVDGRRLDAPELRPLFEELHRRGTPVLLHPMTPWGIEQMGDLGLAPLTGFMFDTTLTVTRMVFSGMLDELPDLKLIVPHTGGTIPYLWARFDNGWRSYPEARERCPEPPSSYLSRLYYDTVSFHQPAPKAALETVGARRLVLGSDYPHVIGDPKAAVATVQRLDVSERDREAIFAGNLLRLLARA
jgi:aminocarboxymuconate-semialdehyde decarboxylase